MITGLLQYNIAWEDKAENKKKIASIIEQSAYKGAIDWLIFSEMTLSGFTMNRDISELDDSDRDFFSELAARYSMHISFGGVESGYNKLITIDRTGKRVAEYSKIHLYAYGEEDKYYRPGTIQTVFELEGVRIMPAVCFDLRFPYLFWNQAADVDVYVVIAAWPAKRAVDWMTLLRARALENQAYCVGVNRLGFEGRIEFSGNSMGFDPLGKTIADAGTTEGIVITNPPIDPSLVQKTRARFPFLKERKDRGNFTLRS